MSSRAIRKLHGESEIIIPGLGPENSDDELPDEGKLNSAASLNKTSKKRSKKTKKNNISNPFDLLNENGAEDDVEIEKLSDLEVTENDIIGQHEGKMEEEEETSKKRKKKKKKKKMSKEPDNLVEDVDEIEAAVQEVNAILGDLGPSREDTSVESSNWASKTINSILSVEHRNFNPENEMKRIFGSRVVQNAIENNNRRRPRNRSHQRAGWLVQPKENWPPLRKEGLFMKQLEKIDNVQFFTFEHNNAYQQIEFLFQDAVESLNQENVAALFRAHPYHINSLLQLHEMYRMNDDTQTAAELVERALYAFENCFHPSFSLTQGNCRLDYRRSENRAFFVTLFHHIKLVGQRGCYRTALELCKLMLSLDPENDPLCVLLMVDFYAIRSQEYKFLIQLFDEWEMKRNLSQLPNFAFSVALAHFHLALTSDGYTNIDTADELLQDALLRFPSYLHPLLDKCSINPAGHVSSHSYFSPLTYSRQPVGLSQLITIYVHCCWPCWKEREVVTWLERNANTVLEKVDEKDPRVEEYASKCLTRYQGTPRQVCRHTILADIPEARAFIPVELLRTAILSYDPLPPLNSINSYTRPERSHNRLNNPNVVSMFLRSLLPNFNPEQPPADLVGAEAAGAEGGDNVREGMRVLMDAMRDLLRTMQPVPPPIENPQGDEGPDEFADEDAM